MKQAIRICLTIFLILQSLTLISQTLPKRPKIADVRSYNQFNLLSINAGMTKQQVIDKMGGIKVIKIYDPNQILGQKNVGKISNPYSRDMKKDKNGTLIEILWYYTDVKKVDAAIGKDELTPIVFESDLVVGIGWGFFEDYSKRKEIFINLNN